VTALILLLALLLGLNQWLLEPAVHALTELLELKLLPWLLVGGAAWLLAGHPKQR